MKTEEFVEAPKRLKAVQATLVVKVNATLERRRRRMKELPARNRQSDAMSKEMKRLGFRFVGSTICYAHMQATGMVNDHLVTCFRHAELEGKRGLAREAAPPRGGR